MCSAKASTNETTHITTHVQIYKYIYINNLKNHKDLEISAEELKATVT